MKTQWEFLLRRRRNNNLPHALLLTGIIDLEFPKIFAKSMLCVENDKQGYACNKCRGCNLFQAGSHPDFYQIQPEEAGKNIRIDQVRELINQLNQTAQQGGYKIALINPAENLQTAAANALLKTLEEPTSKTLIMLISNRPGLLLDTLRSRCQIMAFEQPDDIPSEQHQRLLSDLKALSNNSADPVQLAAGWLKEPINEIILGLMNIVMDIIKSNSPMKNKKLFSYLDELYKIRQSLALSVNLNQQLLLENLFCTWHEYTHTQS